MDMAKPTGGRRLPLLATALAAALATMLAAASAASANARFTALPNPQVAGEEITFDGSGSTSSCSGSAFAQCDAEEWRWDFGDGTTSTTGPSVRHRYMRPGTYRVTLSACHCHYVSDWKSTSQDITILPPDKSRSVTLTTPLSGAEQSETTPGDPDGTGFATLTFYPDAYQLCYTISFANINASPAMLGHIHKAPRGQVQFAFPVQFEHASSMSPASGCRPIDPLNLGDVLANPSNWYVQFHNAEYPEGVIRGQLGD
jgi:hypothetical protein